MTDHTSLSESQKKWVDIVTKAWTDDTFKAALLANPEEVLKKHGIHLKPNVKYKLHENTAATTHLVLPAKPSDEVLNDFLANAAGGMP
jgi:hypothetical protein